ncbi:hypothetical protein DL96DRAFT_1551943 [Flagelloscypha sp. PMI_526]|nr:hypothetical protein DL96DRAFT_1551943 [Flagelloscypha sp. PMI_526]
MADRASRLPYSSMYNQSSSMAFAMQHGQQGHHHILYSADSSGQSSYQNTSCTNAANENPSETSSPPLYEPTIMTNTPNNMHSPSSEQTSNSYHHPNRDPQPTSLPPSAFMNNPPSQQPSQWGNLAQNSDDLRNKAHPKPGGPAIVTGWREPAPLQSPSAPSPAVEPHPHDTSNAFDASQLAESYHTLLESAKALKDMAPAEQGESRVEIMKRMIEASQRGMKVLEDLNSTAPLPAPPAEKDPGMDIAADSEDGAAKDGTASVARVCLGCDATSTPEWRRGPMGPRTLCNACGLVWAKMVKKRNPNLATKNAPQEEDELASSEEEAVSYGSNLHEMLE